MTEQNAENDQSAQFEFTVSLDDLLYAGGLEGLNSILDERLAEKPEFNGIMATDISYEALTVKDDGAIVIRATFVPDRY